MSDSNRRSSASESTVEAVDRRTVLRGTATAVATSTLLGAAFGSASAHPTPSRLVVVALSDHVEYRIEVSGEVAKGPAAGESDEIRDGSVAVGRIDTKGEIDDFRFSGEVTDVDLLKGNAEFRAERAEHGEKKTEKKTVEKETEKDGKKTERGAKETERKKTEKKTDGDEKHDEDHRGDGELAHEVAIHAEGPHVDYEFEVSGEVEPGPEADVGVGDEIRDGVVTGNVAGGGVDDYRYSGEITRFHVSSERVTVQVDGETVAPSSLGAWEYVSLSAQGTHVDYRFVVSGDVVPASEADIGVGDHIAGHTATGNVAGQSGVDSYWFTGEITEFETSSDEVTVMVNENEVDPDEVA